MLNHHGGGSETTENLDPRKPFVACRLNVA